MTTMIEDAVAQLTTSITERKPAQPRLYAPNQVVAVRYRTEVNGRELTTWRHERVLEAVRIRDTWLYWVFRVEGRTVAYSFVVQSDVRKP